MTTLSMMRERIYELVAQRDALAAAARAALIIAWEVGTETEDGVATLLDDARGDLFRQLTAALAQAGFGDVTVDVRPKDAALIAAAPDMAEALRDAYDLIRQARDAMEDELSDLFTNDMAEDIEDACAAALKKAGL